MSYIKEILERLRQYNLNREYRIFSLGFIDTAAAELAAKDARIKELEEVAKRLRLYIKDRDEFEQKYGAPEFPDSSWCVEKWLKEKIYMPTEKALQEGQ